MPLRSSWTWASVTHRPWPIGNSFHEEVAAVVAGRGQTPLFKPSLGKLDCRWWGNLIVAIQRLACALTDRLRQVPRRVEAWRLDVYLRGFPAARAGNGVQAHSRRPHRLRARPRRQGARD